MTVTRTLLRQHRTIVLVVSAILVLVVAVGLIAITRAGPMTFSFWLVIAGSMAKYWPLVVGIMVISTHFRMFVAHGVTRREFLTAVAAAGLVFAVGFAIAVVAGHAVESSVLGLFDQRAADYPVLAASDVPGEVGRVIPLSLGYYATGVLITAGFYRFRPLIGLALIVPGAVPAAVAEGLLNLDEWGTGADRLAYPPALAIALAALAAAAAATWAILRDTPIKPTTV